MVLKVDPPSWWVGHSVNPVRLMIRGRNLNGAKVDSRSPGVSVGAVDVSASGDYLFLDVTITTQATPGVRTLFISNAGGKAQALFDVLAPMPREGRYQGFSSDDLIYLIVLDRFADGDAANDDLPGAKGLWDRKKVRSYHGGDLQGVIGKLAYLKELGVSAIWLTPVYQNYEGLFEPTTYSTVPFTDYHGYGPADYYSVDRHLGTAAKLRELVDKAHELGIKIIMDQVFNHTSQKHPWLDDPPTPSWFHGTAKDHLRNTFNSWVVADPHAGVEETRPVLDGWLDDHQPDLNQDDPQVARYLIQNALWWLGTSGADGLRFDALNFVPRSFWKECLAALRKEYPNLRSAGEVYAPEPDPALIGSFQTDGLDGVFDFPLRKTLRSVFLEGKPISDLANVLSRDRLYSDPLRLITFLGLHDDSRFMGLPGADSRALKLAFTLLLTTRGIPLLYYGDEIGMRGADDPYNRADFPGGWRGDPRNAFTPSGRTPDENDLFDYLKRLAGLRATCEPLRRGSLVNLVLTDSVYVYARVTGSSWAIVVLNKGPRTETLSFSLGPVSIPARMARLDDRLGGKTPARVEGGRVWVDIPARSAAVYTP